MGTVLHDHHLHLFAAAAALASAPCGPPAVPDRAGLARALAAQPPDARGWVRGTEALTEVVGKAFSKDGAELLHQPVLLEYFERKLTEMPPKLKRRLTKANGRRFVCRWLKLPWRRLPAPGKRRGIW